MEVEVVEVEVEGEEEEEDREEAGHTGIIIINSIVNHSWRDHPLLWP